MKALAWYTIIIISLVQMYVLGDVVDGNGETFTNLFIMACYVPPIAFAVKYLKDTK